LYPPGFCFDNLYQDNTASPLTKGEERRGCISGAMLVRRAKYELDFNRKDKAKEIIVKIRNEMPEYNIPADVLSKID
jgi:hypothetical protein